MLIGAPSEKPQRAARAEPAASMTARTSSIRSYMVGIGSTRSDRPVPLLSKRISRQKEASRLKKLAECGSSIVRSRCDTEPGTNTRSKDDLGSGAKLVGIESGVISGLNLASQIRR